MGYVKLDDAFLDHPKFLEAGPLAGYLAICAIAWSNRNRTDGFIPEVQVKRLASFDELEVVDDGVPVVGSASLWRLAEDLVLAGLWEKVDRGFVIHDYLEWQHSADEIRALSTARAEAGRRGAEARWGSTARANQQQPDANGHGTGDTNGHSNTDGKTMAKECQKEEVRSKEQTPMASKLADVRDLFAYWQQRCGHPTSKLTAERRRKIEARLREGYTVAQVRQAIDGAARAAFVNDNGKRFDDIELICRNGTKLEDFMGRAGSNGSVSSAELGERLRGGAA